MSDKRHAIARVGLLGGRGSQLIEFLFQRSEARGVKCFHLADHAEFGVNPSKANVEVLTQMGDHLLKLGEAFFNGLGHSLSLASQL